MPNAQPVADMHVDMPMAHDAMHTDIDSHDSPCGEAVAEGEDEINNPAYLDIIKNLLMRAKSTEEFKDYLNNEMDKDPKFGQWMNYYAKQTPLGKRAINVYYGRNMIDEVGVDEDWDNSPDENYKDDNFMVHDMGDDLHRKKDRRAIRTVDPALESTLKQDLKADWQDYKNK